MIRGGWISMLLCLAACFGGDSDSGAGDAKNGVSCVDGDDACGSACGGSAGGCPVGLYCNEDGKCAKECSPDPENTCDGLMACNAAGKCIPTSSISGPGVSDDGGIDPGVCADTIVQASMVTPTVILIIDQSGSMNENFQDGTRWDVLRNFLLQQPGGLIDDLQSQVRFGLAMYSAVSDDNGQPDGECPLVELVAPALDNYAAIQAAYAPAEPIDDTPTGDSIDKIIDDLNLENVLDTEQDPTVFILATDGEPDRCEELDPQNGQDEAIAAVERAHSLGVRTFIISVGQGTVSEEHQQAVANAGLGRGPGDDDAEFWVAGDDATLRQALTDIVGGQLGCEVQLNGKVESGDACDGTVRLNGVELECGGDDGWELSGPSFIRLLGQACDDLKSKKEIQLEVSFPCTVGLVD